MIYCCWGAKEVPQSDSFDIQVGRKGREKLYPSKDHSTPPACSLSDSWARQPGPTHPFSASSGHTVSGCFRFYFALPMSVKSPRSVPSSTLLQWSQGEDRRHGSAQGPVALC
jgi:hypothetical protein